MTTTENTTLIEAAISSLKETPFFIGEERELLDVFVLTRKSQEGGSGEVDSAEDSDVLETFPYNGDEYIISLAPGSMFGL
jgi:hypothetical protein